jgi:tetratricopeptide (TPR) repeat protein
VQVLIARHYRERGDFATALKYAQDAASGDSTEASLLIAACHEFQRNWVQAEKHLLVTSDRSGGSAAEWYAFCLRTGYGNVEAARNAALGAVRNATTPRSAKAKEEIDLTANVEDESDEAMAEAARFYLLEGRLERSLEWWQKALAKRPDAEHGLLAALAAHQLQRIEARDAALRSATKARSAFRKDESESDGAPRRTSLVELARWLQTSLSASKAGTFDLPAIERIAAAASADDRATIYYCVGRFLELSGRANEGRSYVRRSVATPAQGAGRTLACMALRRRGFEPNDVKLTADVRVADKSAGNK